MIHYRKMKIWLFEKNRLKKREVTRVIDRNSFLNKFIIIQTSQPMDRNLKQKAGV